MANLTGYMNPLFNGLEKATGVPTEQWSAHLGGELYGWLIDVATDELTPKGSWFDPVLKILIGIGAGLYGAFGENVSEVNRRSLIQLSETTILSAIRYLVEDPAATSVRNSLAAFINALQAGDLQSALSTMLKIPKTPGVQATQVPATAPPPPPPPPPVTVAPPAPAQAPAQAVAALTGGQLL